MEEQARPTGITYEDANNPGSIVVFEGREARIVNLRSRASIFEQSSQRLTLDVGGRYLVIVGYFSDGELIETIRADPFSGTP